MKWQEVENDIRYKDSTPEIKSKIQEDWFQKNIRSDPRYKPELENRIKNDIFGKPIPEIKQAKPESFLDSIFHKDNEDEVAKSHNIYTISQKTGKPLEEVAKNYDREKVRFLKPPESFSPEDKIRRTIDQGFAKGLIGTKPAYPEFDKEHPVLNAIGEGAGGLAGLIATGTALKGLGVGSKIYKGIVGKFGLGSIPIAKTLAKVVETGMTFGTKTAAERTIQLSNHEKITLDTGKDILNSTVFGLGLGAVGSIAKPLIRISGEMIYGYTTAKINGADNLNATINAAVFGIFGLTNLSDYSKEYKISAINNITETVAKKAEGFGLPAAEAQRQAKEFVEGNLLKTTGEIDVNKAWDKVLTSKEYNLKYFNNINETLKTLEKTAPKLTETTVTPEQEVIVKEGLDKELNQIVNPKPTEPVISKAEVKPTTIDQFNSEITASAKKTMRAGETLEENIARTKDWISSTLTNDENSTNAELIDYFQKEGGFSKEVAEYIVSKRQKVKEFPLGVKKEMKEEKVISDPAKIQEIKNSIAEGEMIVKSGKSIAGRKMSVEEINAVRRSVENAKAKIGLTSAPKVEEKKNISNFKVGDAVELKDGSTATIQLADEKGYHIVIGQGKDKIITDKDITKKFTEEGIEAEKEEPIAQKKEKVEVKLSDEDKVLLDEIYKEVETGQPGYKYVGAPDSYAPGKRIVGFEPSTYPAYFQNRGYTKKNILALINKAKGGKLTEKQKATLDDLMQVAKEQKDEEQRIKVEGVDQSEIDEVKRAGEAEAFGLTESGENNGIRIFATSEEANAYIDDIESKGGQAEITNVTPEEVKVSYILPETLTPSGQVRQELKPPIKKDLFQEEGELFKKSTDFAQRKKPYESLSSVPEYNTNPEIVSLDAFVDKIRELDPKKDDIDYKEGYRYEAKVSYPHSLGEQGNYTTFVYKDKPTIAELKQDILQEYKDFKKEVNEEMAMGIVAKSGRDEAIEEVIDKVLPKEEIVKVYHATPKRNIESIRKEGLREGVVSDTKSDAEEYAQMLRNRGEKEVEVIELELPKSQLESKGVVKTASGKRIGERFNIKETITPSGTAFAKDSILWGNNMPIEQGSEYYNIKLKPIEYPELVRLAKELTGLYPKVVRKTGKAAGRFYSKNGQIKLIGELFKQGNEQELAIVLAHEFGHLTDWLPDNTLKRGNIIGRLLSLRGFLTQTFGELSNKELKEELHKVTQYMHPFNDKVKGSYLSYRYSSRELYAEAISLLLNSPGTMEKLAPQFTKYFFENLDKKTDVKQAYFDLMELLNGNRAEILESLDSDIRRMFAKADPLRKEKMTEKKVATVSLFERLRQLIDNKYRPILKQAENLEKMGTSLSPDKNPKYILEEYAMQDNAIYSWCQKVDKEVKLLLDEAGLSEDDLGVYTFLKRIIGNPEIAGGGIEGFDDIDKDALGEMIDAATGKPLKEEFTDRKNMANPLGVQPKRAQEQLEYLKNKLGEDKFNKLAGLAQRFHDLVFEVVEEAVKLGSYNQKVFEERIAPNKDYYVSFGVINYMQNYVSAGVKKQMGTLEEIENPFITTILKTISLIKLNEKQRAMNSIRDILKEHFSAEITESKKHRTMAGGFDWTETPGSMKLLEDGKMMSYEVDPYIASSLRRDSSEMSAQVGNIISTIFGNRIFKDLYITYNPGFAFAFNPIRDIKRTYKALAAKGYGVSLGELLVEVAKNMPSSYRRLRGITDTNIQEMIDNRALDIPFNDFLFGDYTDKDQAYNALLHKYRLAKTDQEVSDIRKTLLKPIIKVLEFVRFHGSAIESVTKIAGYNILKKKDVYPAERAYITRNYIGTPNFRNKGLATDTTNAIFMFSNIMKEGLKADIGLMTNPKTRSGYWWATAKLDLLPKLLMILASAGLFGGYIKELFDRASEYDKTNYIIIPVGINGNGKVSYFRIPHDETGRLISAAFWKLANTLQSKPDQLQQIFALGAGQLPGLAPGIQIATGWGSYLQGKNPYDNFRGREVISDTEWKAGGWNSLKKMIQWTANQTGQVSFVTYDKDSNSTFESVVQATPLVNRLLKVTDYGLTEELRNIQKIEQKKSAQKLLVKREAIDKAAEEFKKGKPATEVYVDVRNKVYGADHQVNRREENYLLKALKEKIIKNKYGTYVDAIMDAGSNEEKKQILYKMKEDMPIQEVRNTVSFLLKFRVINDKLMTPEEWKVLIR